jgi:nucleoside 2-deoxyribosyltransferase
MTDINKKVFLSGPMRGVQRSEALAWRNKVKDILGSKFKVLHAYRGREEKETITDPRLAIIRDKNDILRSDIVIVNDTYPNASMIGTAMEVFFAHSLNKTIIVFGEAHLNDYWLDCHSHIRVKSLEEACGIVIKFFSD